MRGLEQMHSHAGRCTPLLLAVQRWIMRMVTRVIIRSSDGDESDHQIIRWWSIITLTSAHHCTLHTYQICMSCSFLSLKRPGHYHSPHLSFFMQWSAQYIIRETFIQKIVSSHMKKKHHLHNVKIWPLNKQWERKDYIWKSKLEDLKRSPSPTIVRQPSIRMKPPPFCPFLEPSPCRFRGSRYVSMSGLIETFFQQWKNKNEIDVETL